MQGVRLAFLGAAACSLVSGQTAGRIREVDFANHAFPSSENDSWPSELKWLSTSERNRIVLVNGRWRMPGTPADIGSTPPWAGLTLEEVIYGDLTGDASDEAVVVIRYDSGGTQYDYFVYIYSYDANRPKLLAYFRSGDRAARGLYRLFVKNRKLVVDLYDPEKQQGDCCSSGFVRQRYRWSGGAFMKAGASERGEAKDWSRRRVTTFGMPYDEMPR